MAIHFKDYYEVLGLQPEASQDEIRHAFRKLARMYHPDVAPGAEAKFQDVTEAYEVLGNPARRRRYDYLGRFQRFSGFDSPDEQEEDDLEEMVGEEDDDFDAAGDEGEQTELNKEQFSDFFRRFFKEGADRPEETADAEDIRKAIVVTLEEAATGAIRSVTVRRSTHCDDCFGSGRVNQQLCPQCSGHGRIERSENCRVKIPAGVRPGSLVRVPGLGERKGERGVGGNLMLRVKFAEHKHFRISGDDLLHTLKLAPWEAALGGEVMAPTLEGNLPVRVPSGAQHGARIRVKGKGLPSVDGGAGDLLILLHVQFPEQISAREHALWQQLAELSDFKPRSADSDDARP